MMAAAHAAFPQLAGLASQLRQALPPRWPGYHLVVLCGGRLTLHLHYGDMGAILPTLDIAVDCWFLDGFAPARNPSAWTADILSEVGRLTEIEAALPALQPPVVRRGLAAAGFAVAKFPGYGRKRDMIRGVREGTALPHVSSIAAPPMRIAIIGAESPVRRWLPVCRAVAQRHYYWMPRPGWPVQPRATALPCRVRV